jgi:hypothetical protein
MVKLYQPLRRKTSSCYMRTDGQKEMMQQITVLMQPVLAKAHETEYATNVLYILCPMANIIVFSEDNSDLQA